MDLLYSKGGLKKGFSTGTVSAGAIKSSVRYYFSKKKFETISVDMPGGESVNIDVADLSCRFLKNGTKISTAVIQKFSGDDIDVTGGIKIYADFMIIGKKNQYKYIKKSPSINYSNNVNNDNISNVNDNDNDNYNDLKGLSSHEYDNGSNNDFDKINAENIKDYLKNYFNEFYHKKLIFYDIIENVKNQIIQGTDFNLFADNTDFLFSSAEGIGVATKHGLPVNIGSPAINPVPLDMIKKNVLNEFKNIILNDGYDGYIRNSLKSDIGKNAKDVNVNDAKFFLSVLYIPDGEDVSKKTLNSRLGIEGGLSILGTTGYVIPISAKAWLDTIKSSLLFLHENNIDICVFTPGRFSEKCAIKIFKNFSEEYFIEIGDFVSYSIRKAAVYGIKNIILAGQFGKIVKISQGERNTNAKYSNLNLNYIGEIIKKYFNYKNQNNNLNNNYNQKNTDTNLYNNLDNNLSESFTYHDEELIDNNFNRNNSFDNNLNNNISNLELNYAFENEISDLSEIYEKVINSNTSREAFLYISSIKNGNVKKEIINEILFNAKKNIEKINNGIIKCKIILLSYNGDKIFETE
ncbi:MAG: cobalt-precorrin-5B (C(1))-methyltransferase [Candidatus Acididesulfobacter diazotrophicus]|jgi:cobalamin biosynthesis protein CbiD|uniref:Cobalt-precorrin-5B C(1)-methyltransferase n=1 Tax=Candidatus Acididesulfobacter diazotrophicus TaxID=2597226 RepID=A0A519BM34_9DELT|nr:MAG: cobalt-precorrin-5B (C(1))-methyltransferase [Candidatus Acididesulfobacter diazotrophicus]